MHEGRSVTEIAHRSRASGPPRSMQRMTLRAFFVVLRFLLRAKASPSNKRTPALAISPKSDARNDRIRPNASSNRFGSASNATSRSRFSSTTSGFARATKSAFARFCLTVPASANALSRVPASRFPSAPRSISPTKGNTTITSPSTTHAEPSGIAPSKVLTSDALERAAATQINTPSRFLRQRAINAHAEDKNHVRLR